MTNFPQEAKTTRELFDAYLNAKGDGYNGTNWTSERQMMANLWNMMYTGAYRVRHITEMLAAINQLQCRHKPESMDEFEDWVQKELTRLCRAKVLRSRYSEGRRFYEVNY